MATFSHRFDIQTLGRDIPGTLSMKSGSAFSTTTNANTSFLTATQVTAINTFLTAVSTLNTALGSLSLITIKSI